MEIWGGCNKRWHIKVWQVPITIQVSTVPWATTFALLSLEDRNSYWTTEEALRREALTSAAFWRCSQSARCKEGKVSFPLPIWTGSCNEIDKGWSIREKPTEPGASGTRCSEEWLEQGAYSTFTKGHIFRDVTRWIKRMLSVESGKWWKGNNGRWRLGWRLVLARSSCKFPGSVWTDKDLVSPQVINVCSPW